MALRISTIVQSVSRSLLSLKRRRHLVAVADRRSFLGAEQGP